MIRLSYLEHLNFTKDPLHVTVIKICCHFYSEFVMALCMDSYKVFYIQLEHGTMPMKIATLKKVIQLILQGEKYPGLLMTIIRFLLPTNDHTLKKLLLIFWEIVPKTTGDGKLLQEMILVCDAYRKVCALST